MGQKQNGGDSEGETRGVAEKGQSGIEFVRDPLVIQLLGHIHMLICIYAQGQPKYILVLSSILFLYLIHFIVHTLFQFFLKFPYFSFCCSIHLKKPVISTLCFHLGACVPTCHAESNCIICTTCAHLGTNFLMHQTESKQRASYEIIGWDGVYVGSVRHTPTFLSLVI